MAELLEAVLSAQSMQRLYNGAAAANTQLVVLGNQ
jgi:hypothetical protein